MNWLDVVILVVLAITTFLGFKIGIIKIALSLVGVIVGVVLAGRYYDSLAGKLTFISQGNVAEGVAFAIILVAVMIVAGIAAGFLRRVTSLVMLGWVNHLGGALFGLVLGAILCGALLAISTRSDSATEVIRESGIANLLLDRLPAVLALLPGEFDTVRSFFQ